MTCSCNSLILRQHLDNDSLFASTGFVITGNTRVARTHRQTSLADIVKNTAFVLFDSNDRVKPLMRLS